MSAASAHTTAAAQADIENVESNSTYSCSNPSLEKRIPLAKTDAAEYFRRVGAIYASSGAIILGNILEWYDWTVFGYMEDLISELFTGGGQTLAWLIFAIPFVFRPFGALLLGWVGDRLGRTVSLNIAIWGMAASTVLQGCIPTRTPVSMYLLIALRVLSGISAGGESAGVGVYMTEAGGSGRDETLVASVGVNNISGGLAFFLANIVSLLIHQLPKEMQLAWAWRVPFLAAAPLGAASVIMRRKMAETEAFKSMKAGKTDAAGTAPEAPVPEEEISGASSAGVEGSCIANARSTILVVVALAAINSCNYFPVYLAAWLRKSCGFSATVALALTAVYKLVQVFLTFPVSLVGDRIGATSTMLAGGVACTFSMLPALLLVVGVSNMQGASGEPTAFVYVFAFLLLGIALPIPTAFYNVPSPLYMTSLFPAEFRGRGAGLGQGLASMAGGFTPMICSALALQQSWLPGLFVTLLTLPSLAALAWCRQAATRGVLPIHQRSWLF